MHRVHILTVTDRCDFDRVLLTAAFTQRLEAETFGYDYCKRALAASAEPDVFDPHATVQTVDYGHNNMLPPLVEQA
jgi:hypothetical protein